MSLSPHKFREIVFQFLYSQDLHLSQEDEMVKLLMAELEVSKKNVKIAQERANLIVSYLPEIDKMIASVSTNYDFDRIQTVTKNILRLGTFELFFDDEIPPKVAIAEAVRLSRKFCTPESAGFANAILDNLYQQKMGNPTDQKEIAKETKVLEESEKTIENLPPDLKMIDSEE